MHHINMRVYSVNNHIKTHIKIPGTDIISDVGKVSCKIFIAVLSDRMNDV